MPFYFLLFYLYVTLSSDKVYERHFTIKALEYRNDFGSIGYGKV